MDNLGKLVASGVTTGVNALSLVHPAQTGAWLLAKDTEDKDLPDPELVQRILVGPTPSPTPSALDRLLSRAKEALHTNQEKIEGLLWPNHRHP